MERIDAHILNGTEPSGRQWFRVVNQGSDTAPAELSIYDSIGKSMFDDSGVGAEEFANALKEIPAGRQIAVHINCPGGSVWDALAIFNQLQARKDKVVCIVDGIALSAASWIALAGRECRMARNSQLMIHEPKAYALQYMDAGQMRQLANRLEETGDLIAGIYAQKGKLSKDQFREKMKAETWYKPEAAKADGLCDVITDSIALSNTFDLSGFRSVPENLINHAPENPAAQSGEANDHKTQ